jgi:hypothetical protein
VSPEPAQLGFSSSYLFSIFVTKWKKITDTSAFFPFAVPQATIGNELFQSVSPGTRHFPIKVQGPLSNGTEVAGM